MASAFAPGTIPDGLLDGRLSLDGRDFRRALRLDDDRRAGFQEELLLKAVQFCFGLLRRLVTARGFDAVHVEGCNGDRRRGGDVKEIRPE